MLTFIFKFYYIKIFNTDQIANILFKTRCLRNPFSTAFWSVYLVKFENLIKTFLFIIRMQ